MSGHSIGARAVCSSYDFSGAAGARACGTMVGAGAVYGWAKVLNRRINLRPHVCCGAAVCFEGGNARVCPLADIGFDIQIILR